METLNSTLATSLAHHPAVFSILPQCPVSWRAWKSILSLVAVISPINDLLVSCFPGDCVNSGTLRVAAGTSRGTEWHVVVLPYKCDSCSITVSVVPVDAADGSAGLASPPASAKEAANMKVCENCGERVPAARYTLHTAYCARHNVRCATCGRVVRKVSRSEWCARGASCFFCLPYQDLISLRTSFS